MIDLEHFQQKLEEKIRKNNSFETAKNVMNVYQITDSVAFTTDVLIKYWNLTTETYFEAVQELEDRNEFELCYNVMKYLDQEKINLLEIYIELAPERSPSGILQKLNSIYNKNKKELLSHRDE